MRACLAWLLGDVPPGLAGLLLIVVMAMASSTRQYAPVWQSEPAIWQHAVRLAPEKPRTLNNYAVTLVMQGRLVEARDWFERAHRAGHSSHLPPWDRVEGEQSGRANLKAIDALLAAVR